MVVNTEQISALLDRQKPGFALEQAFYVSRDIFDFEREAILRDNWYMAGHVSRIPEVGDYFLWEIMNESIIVVRSGASTVKAFFNVCRHKGSRVCLEAEGKKRMFTCPYHAWTYGLDGRLANARSMGAGFNPADYSLVPCSVQTLCGLIFINLSDKSRADFERLYGNYEPLLNFHGLAEAQVAARDHYPTDANWKLVLENFFECYHCAPAHPEYCRIHSPEAVLAMGSSPDSELRQAYMPVIEAWRERASALGHPVDNFGSADDDPDYRGYIRAPLGNESLSETEDGKPAAPIMGKFREFDGGHSTIVFNPFSWILGMTDFAVLFRFTPIANRKTELEVTWLVAPGLEAGKDYDLDKVCYAWRVTAPQDKMIVENNQNGIESSRFTPGPYSEQELPVVKLMEWYRNRMQTALGCRGQN